MDKYEDKSDFEINELVALARDYLIQDMDVDGLIGMTPSFHHDYPDTVWVAEHEHGCPTMAWEQYCPTSDPSDAWPIITENMISIRFDATHSKAWAEKNYGIGYTVSVPHEYRHKNTLRAAMIVFLEMQEAS